MSHRKAHIKSRVNTLVKTRIAIERQINEQFVREQFPPLYSEDIDLYPGEA